MLLSDPWNIIDVYFFVSTKKSKKVKLKMKKSMSAKIKRQKWNLKGGAHLTGRRTVVLDYLSKGA